MTTIVTSERTTLSASSSPGSHEELVGCWRAFERPTAGSRSSRGSRTCATPTVRLGARRAARRAPLRVLGGRRRARRPASLAERRGGYSPSDGGADHPARHRTREPRCRRGRARRGRRRRPASAAASGDDRLRGPQGEPGRRPRRNERGDAAATGQVFTVFSPKGGTGKTVLATNLAAYLASKTQQARAADRPRSAVRRRGDHARARPGADDVRPRPGARRPRPRQARRLHDAAPVGSATCSWRRCCPSTPSWSPRRRS